LTICLEASGQRCEIRPSPSGLELKNLPALRDLLADHLPIDHDVVQRQSHRTTAARSATDLEYVIDARGVVSVLGGIGWPSAVLTRATQLMSARPSTSWLLEIRYTTT
jgi:hypothetical protein